MKFSISRRSSGIGFSLFIEHSPGGALNRFSWTVVVTGSHNLSFRVVQVLRRILDHQRRRIGTVKGVPDNVQPVAIAQLLSLVPFVRREANRLAALTSFNLDPTNA